MAAISSTEQEVLAIEKRGWQRQTSRLRASPTSEQQEKTCDRCGRMHKPRNCPAFNVECRKCGKRNPFAAVCRSASDVAPIDTESMGVDACYDPQSMVFCVCVLCVFSVCCAAVVSDPHRWRESSQPNQHLCMTPPFHNPVHLVPVINHPSTSIYCAILCLFERGDSLCVLVSILLCCVGKAHLC